MSSITFPFLPHTFCTTSEYEYICSLTPASINLQQQMVVIIELVISIKEETPQPPTKNALGMTRDASAQYPFIKAKNVSPSLSFFTFVWVCWVTFWYLVKLVLKFSTSLSSMSSISMKLFSAFRSLMAPYRCVAMNLWWHF